MKFRGRAVVLLQKIIQATNPIYVDQITINGKTGMGADKIT